ncbi:MAG: OmpA family protein [Proteobacteria bacterium]|nr:OmpA family protein [Pseudomonadota bacterium]
MAGNNDQKKIIKKIYKKSKHAHHGGAWKIAYADFVTAMMAFFMLMWLINSISVEQKKGIADYFSPNFTAINKNKASNDGMMAGKNATGVGMTDNTGGVTDESNENASKVANANSDRLINEDNTGGKKNDKDGGADKSDQKSEAAMSKDLLEIREQLKRAVESNVSLKALSNQIEFSITSEGLNINITDRGNNSMFPPGSVEMYDYMKNLLKEISLVIKQTKNLLTITGHTDAIPYASTRNYSNWELSADRANAVRRFLKGTDIPNERFESVKGRESKDLLNKNDPSAPENRRITITLLK